MKISHVLIESRSDAVPRIEVILSDAGNGQAGCIAVDTERSGTISISEVGGKRRSWPESGQPSGPVTELIEVAEDLRDLTDQFATKMKRYLTLLEEDGSSSEVSKRYRVRCHECVLARPLPGGRSSEAQDSLEILVSILTGDRPGGTWMGSTQSV